MLVALLVLGTLAGGACSSEGVLSGPEQADGGGSDLHPIDAAADMAIADASISDTGSPDAGTSDAGTSDSGTSDSGTSDTTAADMAADAPAVDAGAVDASPPDAGAMDTAGGGRGPWRSVPVPVVGGQMTGIQVSPHDSNLVVVSGDMLGIGVSVDRGLTWRTVTGIKTYECGEVTFDPQDPDLVWVGCMGGPVRVHLSKATATIRRSGMGPSSTSSYSHPIQQILVDPTNHQHLLACEGSRRDWNDFAPSGHDSTGKIWSSTDGGSSWTHRGTISSTANIRSFDALQRGTTAGLTQLIASTQEGLFRSADGGASWSPDNAGIGQTDMDTVIADPTTAGRFWSLSRAGKIYVKQTFSGGWSQLTALPASAGFRGLTAISADGTRMLAGAPGAYATWITDDGWKTHKTVLPGTFIGNRACPAGWAARAYAIAPLDRDLIFVVQSDSIARSTDGGSSWRDIANHEPSSGQFVGHGYQGWVAKVLAIDGKAPQRRLAGAMDAGKWLSVNGGSSWRFFKGNGQNWNGIHDADYSPGGRLWVVFGQRDWQGVATTDNDLNWVERNGSLTKGATGKSSIVAVSNSTALTIRAGAAQRTTDGGASWSTVLSGTPLRHLTRDPSSAQVVYASGDGGVWRSANGGASFTKIWSQAARGKAAVAPGTGALYQTVWNAASQSGLWRHDGTGWQKLKSGRYSYAVAVNPSNTDELVVVEQQAPFVDQTACQGPWYSADNGKTWEDISDGLPMVRGQTCIFDPLETSTILIGTTGSGYYQRALR